MIFRLFLKFVRNVNEFDELGSFKIIAHFSLIVLIQKILFSYIYRKAWFAIDLGVWLIPTCYTLRHARGYGRSALRNWQLQVSKDSQTWITLFNHVDDTSLNEPGLAKLYSI